MQSIFVLACSSILQQAQSNLYHTLKIHKILKRSTFSDFLISCFSGKRASRLCCQAPMELNNGHDQGQNCRFYLLKCHCQRLVKTLSATWPWCLSKSLLQEVQEPLNEWSMLESKHRGPFHRGARLKPIGRVDSEVVQSLLEIRQKWFVKESESDWADFISWSVLISKKSGRMQIILDLRGL